ncbi:MAG TPA: hypothetical protein DCZ23_01085 [Lachnospiraceae bacterium]|nr:hypothetical protein [Lachnospiraceae bacterium]
MGKYSGIFKNLLYLRSILLHLGKIIMQFSRYIKIGRQVIGIETYSNNGFFRKQPDAMDKSENALAGVRKEADNKNTLLVKTKSKSIVVNKNDIMYIESNKRKKEIHMTNGIIEIYSTMGDLKCLLGDGFYQCHRGFIVNMAHVLEYTSDSIKISSGEVVYMSKDKYSGFEDSYALYLER